MPLLTFARDRSLALTASLVVLVVGLPMIDLLPYGDSFVLALFAFIPIAGIYAVSDQRKDLIIGIAIGVPTIVVLFISAVDPSRPLNTLHTVLAAMYYFVTTWMILQRLLRTNQISRHTLWYAVSAYMLIGVTFATLYTAIVSAHPGAFITPHSDVLDTSELMYFSIVTLTTLGYGDIVPVSPIARSLAMLEAICGVLYLGTVIARFVGLRLAATDR